MAMYPVSGIIDTYKVSADLKVSEMSHFVRDKNRQEYECKSKFGSYFHFERAKRRNILAFIAAIIHV